MTGPKQMWERACPAKRRAGGARSHRRQKSIARHLEAILQPPDGHLPDCGYKALEHLDDTGKSLFWSNLNALEMAEGLVEALLDGIESQPMN